MDRRLRPLVAAALTAVATAASGALLASPALAVTSDLIDWNLSESLSTYGGGTQFHISSGGSLVSYRWLDTPNKTTVVSGNSCSDLSLYGSSATIAINSTSYYNLFSSSPGLCFVMRGRTSAGSGTMVNHDGRVNR